MIRRQTVFIIGAGASSELGYPLGSELLKRVAAALDINFEGWTQQTGSQRLVAAYQKLNTLSDGGDVNRYRHAGLRLCGAARQARSIDNAIDQNGDNQFVPIVGKLAIAETLLAANKSSKLERDEVTRAMQLRGDAQKCWLYHLGQLLTNDLRKSSLELAPENVAFININYDRSLQQYLPSIFMNAYGLSQVDAWSLCSKFAIVHPYGRLNIEVNPQAPLLIRGGGEDAIIEAAQGIKTFTEAVDSLVADSISTILTKAEQVVFLGFGFHRPNMALLGSYLRRDTTVLGTVYREPDAAIPVISRLVENMVRRETPYDKLDYKLFNCESHDLLRENFLSLTE